VHDPSFETPADGSKKARLAPMPFDSTLWNVPTWAGKRTYFVPEQSKLALRLDAFNGSRASSKEWTKYGLYTVAVQPDVSVGAVTQVGRMKGLGTC
jgi:hypothetical protein